MILNRHCEAPLSLHARMKAQDIERYQNAANQMRLTQEIQGVNSAISKSGLKPVLGRAGRTAQ